MKPDPLAHRDGAIAPVALALSTLAALASVATAQPLPFGPMCGNSPAVNCAVDLTGSFADGEFAFFSGASGGVLENISAGTLTIDQTCDGFTNNPQDVTVAIPSAITNIRNQCPSCQVQWRLTPSQDFIYARVFNSSGVPGCGGGQSLRLYFFAIDPGPVLTPFTGNGLCLGTVGGAALAREPVFHDYPGFPIRTGIAAERAGTFGQGVVIIDLVGRSFGIDGFTYDGPIDEIKFAPAGNAALVVSNSGGSDTQWVLVDLCANPNGSVNTGGTPSGNVTATVAGSTGALRADVSTGSGVTSVPLGDCLCGACCDNATCTDNVFAADCGNFVAGGACSDNVCDSGGGGDATLTVQVTGSGNGFVSSADGQILCPSACSSTYSVGASVQLQAQPSGGAVFTGWSGDCSGANPTVIVQMTTDRGCTANFVQPQADLAITNVSLTPTTLVAGESGVVTVSVAELLGSFGAEFASIQVTLPLGFGFDPATSDPRCTGFPGAQIVSCSIGTLAAGATDSVAVGFTIPPDAASAAPIDVSANAITPDPNPGNNVTTFNASITRIADLGVTLTGSPDPVRPGAVLAYQVQITNAGPSDASNIVLTEMLPTQATVLDANGMPDVFSPCIRPTLPVGGTTPITITLRANEPLADGVQLTASVSVSADETDDNPSNDTATATITVDNAAASTASARRIVIANPNTPMPNGSPANRFFFPSTLSNGAVAFVAQEFSGISGNVSIYRWYEGLLTTVADFTTRPPGAPGPILNADAPDIDGLQVAAQIRAALTGSTGGFGGIYTAYDCGLSAILQEGDPSPGIFGEFTGGGGGVKIRDNRILYWDNGEAFVVDDQGIHIVGLRSTIMPGTTNVDFESYGFGGWDFDGEWAAFRGSGGAIPLPGGGTSPQIVGIYAWRNGNLVKIVDSTDAKPTGGTFDNLSNDVGVDNGLVTFMQGVNGGVPDEIYIHDLNTGVTTLIADTTTPLPGGSGRVFGALSRIPMIDDGRVLFEGRASDGRGAGLYLWENGALRRVVAESGSVNSSSFDGNQVVYTFAGIVLSTWGDPGDYDLNGVVDANDAAELLACVRGVDQTLFQLFPNQPANWTECLSAFDEDVDDDLDLADVAALQARVGAP